MTEETTKSGLLLLLLLLLFQEMKVQQAMYEIGGILQNASQVALALEPHDCDGHSLLRRQGHKLVCS